MKPPFFKTMFNHNTNTESNVSGIDTGTETHTKQSFKEEVDINTIVKRFGLGYELPSHFRVPEYGDFTNMHDFHGAMNAVRAATENFELLPADVRAKFNNDPGAFVDFATDPENRAEIKKLGLLSPEAIERDEKQAQEQARIAQEQRKATTQGGGSQKQNQRPERDE